MNVFYVFALGLALTGCTSSPANPNVPVIEKSLTQQWFKIDHGIASRWVPIDTPHPSPRERVIYMDLATMQPLMASEPKAAFVHPEPVPHRRVSRPIAKQPLTSRPVPGSIQKPTEHIEPTPEKGMAKADLRKPSLQEQKLTMKYAEGDANAAFDLAKLLFSQGRSEPAYVALEYAVRQKNPRAIALYSSLRPEAGGQL